MDEDLSLNLSTHATKPSMGSTCLQPAGEAETRGFLELLASRSTQNGEAQVSRLPQKNNAEELKR